MTVEDDGLDYRDVNDETVTVTNKLKKGRVLGDQREEEKKQKASVKTGDSTPILPLLATMIASGLAALYLALRRRRKI